MQKKTCSSCNALFSGLLMMLASIAIAEEKDVIVTDRPDFVESSDVVGKGRFQAETGVALERTRRDTNKTRVMTTPILLRIGTGATWELRVETDGRIVQRTDDLTQGTRTTDRGYADTSIGAKWHVMDESGTSPSVGVLAHVDLDSGSAAFRGSGLRPSLRAVAEWDLPAGLSLGVMPGLTFDKDQNGERSWNGIFAAVLGKSLSEQTRVFVEIALPQIARSRHGGTVATLDVGMAYLLSPTWQIDTALYKGLNKNTANLTWTVGLSSKF
ncbi:transporter [Actimicrobium sp. CCC2.4]|uniref:transporter n=1 Tax=Actimicrobium sp. CCC2.4 TaxID=3048606 RepID=UPI002AC8A0F9|nr:transporter [Actimicrobium sp. CCC2.4]MEB0134716.1 transporter [Actimicrobium sp. CCC2.4]WPX30658.1 transporter [Actimicrobium sp. CCC2.4]